ncbi:MAG: hypothetical protein V7641_4665 [Blastocatellia bacterium]
MRHSLTAIATVPHQWQSVLRRLQSFALAFMLREKDEVEHYVLPELRIAKC